MPDSPIKVKSTISHLLSGPEWEHIEAFKKRARQLSATKIVRSDSGRIEGTLHFDQTKGMTFSATLPPEEDLQSFYMAFRFFYLKKEPANFLRVLSIVRRHTKDDRAQSKLQSLKQQWLGSFIRETTRFTVRGEPVTPRDLINLWFNAHFFHSDPEKEKRLSEVITAVGDQYAQFLLADSVFEAAKAVLDLYSSMLELERPT